MGATSVTLRAADVAGETHGDRENRYRKEMRGGCGEASDTEVRLCLHRRLRGLAPWDVASNP